MPYENDPYWKTIFTGNLFINTLSFRGFNLTGWTVGSNIRHTKKNNEFGQSPVILHFITHPPSDRFWLYFKYCWNIRGRVCFDSVSTFHPPTHKSRNKKKKGYTRCHNTEFTYAAKFPFYFMFCWLLLGGLGRGSGELCCTTGGVEEGGDN
jgi:hypothetical protein